MKNSKLSVESVSYSYEKEFVIRDIDLTLGAGEIISLLGPSGVGKTTLFNIIAGLLVPDSGGVILNGEEITGQSGHVSYMLQKDMLFSYMTIEDNVSLPLRIKGASKKDARQAVADKFSIFGLEGTEKMYPNQLSGGMRQRAALFRTYMFSGDVCLLDEPFSALDTFTKSEMHSWYLKTMEEIRLSTIFITHDIDEAIKLSERIYILSGVPGRIVEEIKIENRPEDSEEFMLSQEFISYKKRILRNFQRN